MKGAGSLILIGLLIWWLSQRREAQAAEVTGAYALPTGMYDARCDLNKDGIVDEADEKIFLAAYKSMPGDPNWNPAADIDGDGRVTGADYSIFMAAKGAFQAYYTGDEVIAFTDPVSGSVLVGGGVVDRVARLY